MGKAIAMTNRAGGGGGGASTVVPNDVSAITVTGTVDPLSAVMTLYVSVTPPVGGTFAGCHLYLEIPDQSSASANVVGNSVLGGTGDPVSGNWTPLDLGVQTYVAAQQPWKVTTPAPAGMDLTVDIPCRLYAPSFSVTVDNPVVQAGQPGASPNQTFTLVSLDSGTPTAGTNVTQVSGPIVATVLPNDNSTGKLVTPVLVDVATVPNSIQGWVARLVLTWAGTDPTQAASQQVQGVPFTDAGPVYGSPDGINVAHSFAVPTPTAPTSATIWAQSGLMDAGGNIQWNNIVPGITPSWPIKLGVNTGVTDASQVMAATIAASMAVLAGLFGVAPAGITNPLLGTAAVATINVQNLAITNPLLASLAVQASNMAASSITVANAALDTGVVLSANIAALAVGTAAMQNASVTNAIIANLAVSGAKIQSATITGANIASATIAGANIGTATITGANIASATIAGANIASATITGANIASATITDANIASLNVSKLIAGTATFTGDVTLSRGAGNPALVLASTGMTLYSVAGSTSNPYITFSSSALTLFSGSGLSLQISSSGVSVISGAFFAGGNQFNSTGLALAGTSTVGWQSLSTSASASAGLATLPAAPAGFIIVTVGSSNQKIPYYNA